MSRLPEQADEPNRLLPNRAPSSSAQSTSRTVTGGLPLYCALMRRRISTPGQHVEAAVEPAAVRHGIDVAADEQRLLRFTAQRDPEVAGRVRCDLGGEVRRLLPPASSRAFSPGRREGDALRAVFIAGEGAEFLEFLDRPAWIHLAHAAMLESVAKRHNPALFLFARCEGESGPNAMSF